MRPSGFSAVKAFRFEPVVTDTSAQEQRDEVLASPHQVRGQSSTRHTKQQSVSQ